jgi:hypothetical protein
MHTHDLENHDNLYADEVEMAVGETNGEAHNHALLAIAVLLALVSVLGIYLIVS